MDASTAAIERRRGDYGFDAPYVPVFLAAFGAALLVVGLLVGLLSGSMWGLIGPVLGAAFFWLSAGSYIYTTRVGKFSVWAGVLQRLRLRGDERLLDMGCGRGAVLLMAAGLLPGGKAVGLDLWKSSDQSGNRPETTLHNAEAEGVRDRVELHSGDISHMPFSDGEFDVVVSSLAVHNIRGKQARARAIDEAVRVLRPGGRLLIADIQATDEYVERLRRGGMENIGRRNLGWRFWYGGPWMATSLVTARKPGSPTGTDRTSSAG